MEQKEGFEIFQFSRIKSRVVRGSFFFYSLEMVLFLDNIRSVHNVGSIFRTADAVGGVSKIYLGGITPGPLDRWGRPRRDFVKVSLGAEKVLDWQSAALLLPVLKQFKENGYQIWAVEQSPRARSYHRVRKKLPVKLVLMVGNEIKGINPRLLRLSDRIIDIPMKGKKESLNVAVAFGVVVYHLRHLCQK